MILATLSRFQRTRMTGPPKLSVVTVCRNEAPGITSTIESVIDQTYEDFEYIVIDGDSNDGTREIIGTYGDLVDRFVSEPDAGIYDAMNKGVAISTGDYLYFLNGGDQFVDKAAIERIMSECQNVDLVYGDIMIRHEDKNTELVRQPHTLTKWTFVLRTLPHPATFIKRSLFDRFGTFNLRYEISSDYEFFLRVAFRPGVSTLYIPELITLFDAGGVSSHEFYFRKRQQERYAIQKQWLTFPYSTVARLRSFLLSNRDNPISNTCLRIVNRSLRILIGN